MQIVTIKFGHLELSNNLTRDDSTEIARCANDYEIYRNIGSHSFPFPYRESDAIDFIEKTRESGKEIFAIDFKILYDGIFTGVIGLSDVDTLNRSAHVGYWISKEYRNKGIMTAALSMVINYSRDTLRLNRLHTKVLEYNPASLKVLIKNGFSIEGFLRDSYIFEQKLYSEFILGKILGRD
ncbi:MAG: GNAT family N-acetyltransferase [Thermoplasmataceae archaeon]|jgi:ribosomal-protein-alanine N-acetyltransferase